MKSTRKRKVPLTSVFVSGRVDDGERLFRVSGDADAG